MQVSFQVSCLMLWLNHELYLRVLNVGTFVLYIYDDVKNEKLFSEIIYL